MSTLISCFKADEEIQQFLEDEYHTYSRCATSGGDPDDFDLRAVEKRGSFPCGLHLDQRAAFDMSLFSDMDYDDFM